MSRHERSRRPVLAVLTVLVAMIANVVGGATRPVALAQEDGSPALGHAQVIAQGVAAMPAESVAWRVVAGLARLAAEAPVAERSLGFLVAEGGALVVTEEGDGEQTRLAPGEAALVPRGTRQQRASTGGEPVAYYSLELVVAPDVAADYSIGSATLLYAGDPFQPPAGRRDLDLVRDVLEPGETSRVAESGVPTLVLATAGTIRVQPVGGQTRTLATGEAAAVGGALNVTATGGAGASFVAAVIGPAVASGPDGGEVTAAPTTGAIAVTASYCPPGMTTQTLDPGECLPDSAAAALQIFVLGSGANRRGLDSASLSGSTYRWDDLPFGDYLLQAVDLAEGWDRYYVPDLDNLNAPPDVPASVGPNEGYIVPLSAAAPDFTLDLYLLRPAVATGGPAVLGIFVWTCAPGVVAAPDMTNADCTRVDPLASGFDVAITGGGLDGPLSLADSDLADAAGRVWEGIPLGDYRITATLPAGSNGYALRSSRSDFPVTLLADGTGYTFNLDDGLFDPGDTYRRVNIEAYLLTP